MHLSIKEKQKVPSSIDVDFRWKSMRISVSIVIDYQRLLLETIFVNFYNLRIDTMYFLRFYWVIHSWICNANINKLILKEQEQ